jgi:hypothetical protein
MSMIGLEWLDDDDFFKLQQLCVLVVVVLFLLASIIFVLWGISAQRWIRNKK